MTEGILQLHSVTFQYGLIAGDVAEVHLELTVRGEIGRIDGERYDELAPMLRNEMQVEQVTFAAQSTKIAEDHSKVLRWCAT